MQEISVMWFRRDLRIHDNAAFYHALKSGSAVVPIFIFDKHILDELPQDDKRVVFIHQTLSAINVKLHEQGSSLHCYYGTPTDIFTQLNKTYKINAVYTNHDYEPYAQDRDKQIASIIGEGKLRTFKDQVIFEQKEVLKKDGTPYTVFTPYSKVWKALINDSYLKSYPSEKLLAHLMPCKKLALPTLKEMNFKQVEIDVPPLELDEDVILNYHNTRDIPSVKGTTRLSVHLRFGTASVRRLARYAIKRNEKFLNELIWRDFYQSILFHFPHVVGHCFREKYEAIQWRNNEAEYNAWRAGKTGYPIVDAGMRELNEMGWMHNRVRMIVASFLTKHLLIDWRWGEAYFAKKLLDFDLASNNGGWQWAAGCGVDAAPYFRVFNPYTQQAKFDKEFIYVKKWVPEYGTASYPAPIVDHKYARERCLQVYKDALDSN
jgi:deoxyribodipyrimidine photo-lyase